MGHQLTLTETLLQQSGRPAPLPGCGEWEVGRLVMAPAWRRDVDALRSCLSLALSYGCANAPVQALYASCTHVLSRLYRRFAFVQFAKDVPLEGTTKVYTLIRGAASEVAVALSRSNAEAMAETA
jgi:hypothetical protein